MFGTKKTKAETVVKTKVATKQTTTATEEKCSCPGGVRACAKTPKNAMVIYSCTCCTTCRSKCTH